jgi:hypothetical protein
MGVGRGGFDWPESDDSDVDVHRGCPSGPPKLPCCYAVSNTKYVSVQFWWWLLRLFEALTGESSVAHAARLSSDGRDVESELSGFYFPNQLLRAFHAINTIRGNCLPLSWVLV